MKTAIFILMVLVAGPAWAGPLETSFCGEIPDDINFGDNRSEVAAKIGRQPLREMEQDGFSASYYRSSCLEGFDYCYTGYGYNAGTLSSIVIGAVSSADEEKKKAAFLESYNRCLALLTARYGPPNVYTQQEVDPEIFPFKMRAWEFPNNALLLGPVIKTVNDNSGIVLVVCPLEPSGHYDLKNY